MAGMSQGWKAAIKGEARFATIMMLASSLGFAKALGLAVLLPPDAFGHYIALLGIATLGSILASFGRVEGTIKLYPTLFARGQGRTISEHALRLWLRLLALTVVGGLLAAAALSLGGQMGTGAPLALSDIAIIALLTWLIAGLTLGASLVRATTDAGLLQRFTLLRGAFTMMMTLPVAVLSESWRATLIAEGVAMLCILGIVALWLRRASGAARHQPADLAPETYRGGGTLYFATLLGASIPYGGRSAVLLLSGAAVAGAFGLLSLLVQIGILLAGSMAQKLGPLMIRDASEGTLQPGRMVVPLAFLGVLALGALAVSVVSLLIPASAAVWTRYDITPLLLVMVSLQLAFQIHLLFYYALIAVHHERRILEASVGAVVLCYGGFALTAVADFGLVGYLGAMMAADLFRSVYLGASFLRFVRRNRSGRS